MKTMIIPAIIVERLRCPKCHSSHFEIHESISETTILSVTGHPIHVSEESESYMECKKCHSKYNYTGNGIDGYHIDDGSNEFEPEFEPQTVQFNPFYRYTDYERGII